MNHKQPTSTSAKTAEEILRESITYYLSDTFNTVFKKEVIKCMKIYANAKLDEAAENASISFTDILYDSEVAKESILSLKDKI